MLRLRLQGKIVLLTASFVLVVLSIVVGLSAVMNRNESMRQAELLAMSYSAELSQQVEGVFGGALETVKNVARILEGMVKSGAADRDIANSMLESILLGHPQYMGVWTGWEPNAFDGRDREFVGSEGHDSSGRFIPAWHRDGNSVKRGYLTGFDLIGEGEHYLLPMKTGLDTVTEPFEHAYEEGGPVLLLDTVSVPIELDGKRVGVVGVDISVDSVQALISSIRLYDTGFARLVSHGGTVVGHPDRNRIGKPLGEIRAAGGEAVLERMQRGENWFEEAWSEALGRNTFKSYSPVTIGNSRTPWSASMVLVEEEVLASSRRALFISLIAAFFGALILLFIIWLIARWIVKPLRRVVTIAQRGGEGDLTIEREEFGITTRDELGEMADALFEMLSKQRDAMCAIAGAAEKLGETAENFSALAEESNAGVTESCTGVDSVSSQMESLATSAQEITASVEEVAGGAQATAQKSTEMAEEVEHARTSGEEGVRSVEQAVHSIKQVAQDAEDSALEIKRLGDRAREIQSFVTQIGGIADQTNLLALNAAIEAARAGEAGRGFAVVAEEVRKLAEESNKAAKNIAELASIITKDLDMVVSLSETNAKGSHESSALAEETRETINRMMLALSNIASATQDMAAVSQEQAASSEEIAGAVQNIATRVNESASSADLVREQMGEVGISAERVAQESEEVAGLALELKGLVGAFRIEKDSDRALNPTMIGAKHG